MKAVKRSYMNGYYYQNQTIDPRYVNSGGITVNVPEWGSIWLIVSLVLAIVGGILVYFLFVRPKTEPKGKFCRWLKNFLAFKIMWIEAILKITYYVATIFCVLGSFAMLGTDFGMFIVLLIVLPVLLRLIYEGSLILIMIWQNTQNIANKLAPDEVAKTSAKKK